MTTILTLLTDVLPLISGLSSDSKDSGKTSSGSLSASL